MAQQMKEALNINKKVMRGGFVLILVLWLIAFHQNDYHLQRLYVECPADADRPCQNPFYCSSMFDDQCIRPSEKVCAKHYEICNTMKVNPGEVIGAKPTTLYQYFDYLGLLIIGLAYLIAKRVGK